MVSGGGLALHGSAWVALPTGTKKRRRPFLFDVTARSRVCRGKFIAALRRARRRGTLRTLGQSAALAEPGPWETLIATLWKHDWIVYAKPPFGGPAQVLKYLSRYPHRVAISNQRLLSVAHGVVCFEYHDYAAPDAHKALSLPATEFPAPLPAARRTERLHAHLMARSPRVAKRIEGHYGITANRRRQQKLARCRELLGAATPAPPSAPSLPAAADTAAATPEDTTPRCPQCGAPLRIVELLPPQPPDTS